MQGPCRWAGLFLVVFLHISHDQLMRLQSLVLGVYNASITFKDKGTLFYCSFHQGIIQMGKRERINFLMAGD